MFFRSILTLCLTMAFANSTAAAENEQPFVIHEWGTFTVLQDEQGDSLPGVNINEERLPEFTHRLNWNLIKQSSDTPLLRMRSKGIPSSFSAATMRMETPIIYIYPPDQSAEMIDVQVEFQGGWISEWFPDAEVVAPGFDSNRDDLGTLTGDSVGSVAWKNLTINSSQSIPETDQHVWLVPREVRTPTLHTASGEAEKYLFYRGVANIEAPLRVQRDAKTDSLHIKRNPALESWSKSLEYRAMWIVDIPSPGVVAFHRIELPDHESTDGPLATAPAIFEESAYSEENLAHLKAEMMETLIAEGLYEDEAKAMLKTWELSYFQSVGTRLFFTLPREWTDRVLPMKVSRIAEIERVMIGRIELITDRQRQLLARMNKGTASDSRWFHDQVSSADPAKVAAIWQSLSDGSKEVTDFDFDVPDDYQAFLQLGRFRESILTNAAKDQNKTQLRQFAQNYRIELR